MVQSSLSEDPAGNEIPVVAMETVPTVRRIMDIGTDGSTMGMDMIGAVNCAAMVGAAANAHAISVLWYNYLIHQSVPIFGKRNYREHKIFKPMQ